MMFFEVNCFEDIATNLYEKVGVAIVNASRIDHIFKTGIGDIVEIHINDRIIYTDKPYKEIKELLIK